LTALTADKDIKGEGIELQQDLVLNCVNRGLSIIQHDVELGLEDYADKSFDYVILSQTVQTVKNPEKVFKELLRVGKKVVVSFPNFAHWKSRAQLFFSGRAPVTEQLPFSWHNSPNIHFLSLKDFEEFCDELGVNIQKKIPLGKTRVSPVSLAPNWFAEQVIYVTSKD
jgi:methionine biosynthesis protein MetW